MQERPLDSAGSGEPLDELVRRAEAGDEAAWAELVRVLRPLLVASVDLPRGVARFVDAEDVVQEALLDAVRGLRTFEYRTPWQLRRWFRTLVAWRAADARKRYERARRWGR